MLKRLFLVGAVLATLAAPLPTWANGLEAFPRTLLFRPLIADPRWPQISGTMQRYFRKERRVLWSASFGESFPFVGSRDSERPWQLGLQASVFTLWDMQTESNDMVNADFLVGFPYTKKIGPWAFMGRWFHISSHLGDEFILQHRNVDRMNLSYEAWDAKVSHDFPHGFRLYGGGGYLYRRFPESLKPLIASAGAEYVGGLFAHNWLRPVVGADFQKHQQNGWGATDISLRAGIQMQHAEVSTRRLQLLLEYYRGHDPNGQFFANPAEELGLGLHAYF